MRTDPRDACANENERTGWAFIHDLLSHPLMALTWWSKLSLRFHDWTSRRAWPRPAEVPQGPWPYEISAVFDSPFGPLDVRVMQGMPQGFYRIDHPRVRHSFNTKADDAAHAAKLAEAWFQRLADEFGGNFRPLPR